ncbi:MAG TPA: hypothetical protein VKP30_33680 [Polyangiaceae bacterium]|nr:hypothetical protein [Polyangiaceae bacterium]
MAAVITQEQRLALSGEALGLLTEQLTARVVHYRADLETNAELDAITAQVVAQVRAMQDVVAAEQKSSRPIEGIENEQIRSLMGLLGRLLGQNGKSEFIAHWLGPAGKRVAKLFFESELHERTKGDKERVIHSASQGLCYVLGRYANRLRADLESFEYENDQVKEATFERLERLAAELRTEFLSRRSPELSRILAAFSEVLTEFLSKRMANDSEAFASAVVRQSRAAHYPGSVGYKIRREAFDGFRAAWEREWMTRWVAFAAERFVERLNAEGEPFMEETVAFFTDPHLYSETSVVLCEAAYDFLCQEGYLDLPLDWRLQLNTHHR